MATATTATAKPEKGAAAGRSRKKFLIVVILGVLAAAAAWFLLMGPGAGAGEKDSAAKEPELGEVVQLEPITMNLADGRLLKVGLALQLVLEPKEAEVTFSPSTVPRTSSGTLASAAIRLGRASALTET